MSEPSYSERSFLSEILIADPEFYAKDQQEQYVYQFSNGEKKKAPNDQGIYEVPPP